jgi:CRP/FNR family transcriptional regulator, cyclic AMP receptor protein
MVNGSGINLPPARGVSTVRDHELSRSLPQFEGLARLSASEVSTLADLNPTWASSFLRAATPYTARCRQVIHYEGRPTTAVYFVERGRIKCTSTASDGRELLLYEFGAGEFIGLIEALNGTRAVGTAIATETSNLKCVRNEMFRNLVADDPELASKLVSVLAEQLKTAYERSTNLAYESLEWRVLHTLEKLAGESAGAQIVERSLSINELASMVAASRTRVSLVVQDLIRRRRLSRVGGRFVLHSKPQPDAVLPK